jgi:hypothetical protein
MRFACELRGEACVIKNARASSPQLIRVIYVRRSLEAIRTLSSCASRARARTCEIFVDAAKFQPAARSRWPDRSNNSRASLVSRLSTFRSRFFSIVLPDRPPGTRDSRRDESIGSVNRPSSSEALCRFPRGHHLPAKASRNCTSAACRCVRGIIKHHRSASRRTSPAGG